MAELRSVTKPLYSRVGCQRMVDTRATPPIATFRPPIDSSRP